MSNGTDDNNKDKGKRITKSVECDIILSKLQECAASFGNEYILPEHMLYIMASTYESMMILHFCDCDTELLTENLEKFFKEKLEHFEDVVPQQSVALVRVIQNAVFHVASAQKECLDVSDLLIAIANEEKSHAVFFLAEQGITQFDIVNAATEFEHGMEPSVAVENSDDDEDYDESSETKSARKKQSALDEFAVDMTQLAADGRIERIIGREKELSAVMRTLVRKKKNNALLVGEPGVGKTAIAEGLAVLAAKDEVPEKLKGIRIFGVDSGRLIAGTKYRGEFEDRVKKLIVSANETPGAILFFDEIHTLVGGGSTSSSGSMDAANILKGALGAGSLRCIGATTFDEYRSALSRDKAFMRRFQMIDIPEPSESESLEILRGAAVSYGRHHGVVYDDSAISAACSLGMRFMRNNHMPDKGIDLLDEAGALNTLSDARKDIITSNEIALAASKLFSIPEVKADESDNELLRHLEKNLKRDVISQDEAVEKVVNAVKISKAGLGASERPIGAFLFAGPTGVGKTELAKRLASELGIDLIRFDMSEYSEEYSVSKLIGSAPGYVGYESGGLLTEQILRKPHAVLLLDEIEKAHSKIYDMLLQVMDYGSMTDNTGRKADFRNIILIMTSNAGAKALHTRSISFADHDETSRRSSEAVEKIFSPEFRNRLSAIIHFKPLDTKAAESIVRKFIRIIAESFAAKNISFECDEAATGYFSSHGFDEHLGARPLERLIRRETLEKLADEILFGKLRKGGRVRVSERNGKIELKITSSSKKKES